MSDATILNFEYPLQSSIMLQESSNMFLHSIYSKEVTMTITI